MTPEILKALKTLRNRYGNVRNLARSNEWQRADRVVGNIMATGGCPLARALLSLRPLGSCTECPAKHLFKASGDPLYGYHIPTYVLRRNITPAEGLRRLDQICDGLDAVIKEAEGEGAREFEVRVVPNHKKSKLACDIYAGEEYISGAYEREAELFGFDLDKPATYRLTVTRLPDPKPVEGVHLVRTETGFYCPECNATWDSNIIRVPSSSSEYRECPCCLAPVLSIKPIQQIIYCAGLVERIPAEEG